MAVHSADMFKTLKGDFLVCVLKFKEVRWVQMFDMKLLGKFPYLKSLGKEYAMCVFIPTAQFISQRILKTEAFRISLKLKINN
jgi:hypothetical protein